MLKLLNFVYGIGQKLKAFFIQKQNQFIHRVYKNRPFIMSDMCKRDINGRIIYNDV